MTTIRLFVGQLDSKIGFVFHLPYHVRAPAIFDDQTEPLARPGNLMSHSKKSIVGESPNCRHRLTIALVAFVSLAFADSQTVAQPPTGDTNDTRTSLENPTGNAGAKPTVPQINENRGSQLPQPTFDGQSAFEVLKAVCEIGPRVSGTAGMKQQQAMLTKHFEALGAQVHLQTFNVRHPNTGQLVELGNLAVRFHPEREKRLLICCHYDTRPFPDQDKVNPRGVFLGANDGASGVALLYELGKHMPGLPGNFGIDFVFFDGEEFVYVYRRDTMFLGSTHFANQYAANKWPANYSYGVLVDMIGDKNLEIYYEGNSLNFAPRLTRSIWGVAQRLGVKEFVPKKRHKIRDDHLPLNSIARIRTCDIIDFDYPTAESENAYWHTEQDKVENCSAESLTKVGWVLLEWLKEMEKLN